MDELTTLTQQFRSQGVKLIRRIKKEAWSETLVLDFKAASKNSGPMQSDDIKNLAKALSGFANSEGGLIVWGIRADRAASDEPDVAKELKPISKLDVFLSDLWSYTPQFVSPPILNVDHIPIYQSKQQKKGFVVTVIPKTEGDPHMSMGKGDRCYYCRAGASFIKMEHYMVASHFRRKSSPKLEFTYRLGEVEREGSKFKISVIVGIRNVGTSIATYPALKIVSKGQFSPATYGLNGNGQDGLPRRPLSYGGRDYMYAGGLDHVIYPQTSMDVTRLIVWIPIESKNCDDFELSYEIYSDGFATSGTEVISGEQLLKICGL